MTNEEIKLLKTFIAWQSLPFVDNLFTHEDEIIKKFDEWLKLNIGSDDRMTNEKIKSTHGSTYGGVSWSGTYTPKENQPCKECISREAAIKAIRDEYEEAKAEKAEQASSGYLTGVAYLTGLANAAFLIHNLPSVEPQLTFYPPRDDFNTKMDEVRKAYDVIR